MCMFDVMALTIKGKCFLKQVCSYAVLIAYKYTQGTVPILFVKEFKTFKLHILCNNYLNKIHYIIIGNKCYP